MQNPTPQDLMNYTPPDALLAGRVILVTGADSGIGEALARRCASGGATVVLLSHQTRLLEAVYDGIEEAGWPQPAIYPMNLEGATARDYDELADNLSGSFDRLDGLVNNAAAVSGLTPLRHFDAQRWASVMAVNLHAPFLLTRACLPLLEKAPDASIVFSTHDCSRAFWGAYGVAKQGLLGLMRILAQEYLDREPGIRVNGVDTGPVRTRLYLQNYPGTQPGEIPEPEAVVAPYLYLLGPDARGVTGRNFELAPHAQSSS
ncbi:MAG: SDR family NAD(P)-dependent oxidoreductase [Pseudomonadota bacterium]|nr:SDR family NAD(P)-dependent oxidoreductase [Pseudomonadota bacterium]